MIKLISVPKTGILIAATALVFLLNLSFSKEAAAITIDFEDLNSGDPLSEQYSAYGIHFSCQTSELSYQDKILEFGLGRGNVLQAFPSSHIYIYFDNPANNFGFFKWEPSFHYETPQEAPSEEHTVYWQFFTLDGTDMGIYSDSAKDQWVWVSFPLFSEPISKIHIWGVTDGAYYLDNLQFETSSNPVPEPATMLLLGSGLVGLVGFRRRFRKN